MEFINERIFTAVIFTSIRYNFTINIASITTILFWAAIKNVYGMAITVCMGRNEVTLFWCASHFCLKYLKANASNIPIPKVPLPRYVSVLIYATKAKECLKEYLRLRVIILYLSTDTCRMFVQTYCSSFAVIWPTQVLQEPDVSKWLIETSKNTYTCFFLSPYRNLLFSAADLIYLWFYRKIWLALSQKSINTIFNIHFSCGELEIIRS